jgi:serine/threonine-protein kinase
MGTVWAARRRGERGAARIVAVKTMLERLAGDPHFQRMFRVEAELASRIQHPNACRILDLDEQPGIGPCLVMEWIEGSSLQTMLDACRSRGRRVPPGIVARVGAQAARGLHAVHELVGDHGRRIGLVHRDVSPHNLIVSTGGVVKVIDFGIAKAVGRVDNPTTVTGQIKGKVRYLAPEQVIAEPLDHRADIFALGVVLYLLVTGKHPFDADHDIAVMRRILVDEPAATPGALVPGCPPELDAAIMRALAKQRGDRHPSMRELADALDAVAAQVSVGDAEVAAFVQWTAGARIATREARIAAAARAADVARAAAAAARAAALARACGGAAVAPSRRRALQAAALCGLGALLGAAAVVWLAPQRRAVRMLESADLTVPPVAAIKGPAAPAVRRRPAPRPPPATKPSPATSASAAPPRVEPRSRFRSPGF